MRNGSGGKSSGEPDTVEITTRSPLSTVRTGVSLASKYPQWTVSGPASTRAILAFSSIRVFLFQLNVQLQAKTPKRIDHQDDGLFGLATWAVASDLFRSRSHSPEMPAPSRCEP